MFQFEKPTTTVYSTNAILPIRMP